MGTVLAVLVGLPGTVLGDTPSAGDRASVPVAAQIERLVEDAGSELQAFYALRDHRPAWHDRETVAAFAAALHTLDGDGLRPADYRPDALVAGHRQADASEQPGEQARFDLHATRMLMTALEHLQRGKVDPSGLETHWEVPVEAPALDPAAISRAIDGQRFEQAFAEARPSYAPYERLRTGLARYRNIERLGGWEPFPQEPRVLRPGDVDDAVVLLRSRLAVIGELEVMAANVDAFPEARLETPDLRRYDTTLEAAVKRFQRRHLLEVDGIVGPQTRRALNVPVEARIDQIRVNLERSRWLLHGLPETFVLVDIAGYQLRYFRPNGEVWRSRIVVGRPYRRTPSLRSEITHMTVNPSWTIPPTIRRNDVLPEVRRDLGYLWRERIQVLSPSGQPLDPWEVDWDNPGNVVLRQAPGPHNALGKVAIRFPNDHMVYLHDTPSQGLFSRQQRAFSSGCIRVEGVLEFAQLLFDDTDSGRNIHGLIEAGRTRNVSLGEPVPVILHYWTVNPDEDGELAFRPDIYERDEALLRALDRPLAL
ncbi:L,D-transpeptidase family protein [Halomonas campisalis]|uniref:L,D-transpeptidase family protein n=2 Tax=Billgrantia campisalis TaxID=74661 RepID=A0ABS9PCZ0_9GAMM|nr:L,D-transpeptidase family protein [Halomonas campisalis]